MAKHLSTGQKFCSECGIPFGWLDIKYIIGFGEKKRLVCGQCRDRHYNGDYDGEKSNDC